MKSILIVGCGLIGSSILRAVSEKKLFKNIFVFEKSKKNISILKKLKIKCKIINKLSNISNNLDFIIFCTPMSQYSNVTLKINKLVSNNTIITDVGSTKEQSFKNIKKILKKNKIKKYKIVLIVTDHTKFNYNIISKEAKYIFDAFFITSVSPNITYKETKAQSVAQLACFQQVPGLRDNGRISQGGLVR